MPPLLLIVAGVVAAGFILDGIASSASTAPPEGEGGGEGIGPTTYVRPRTPSPNEHPADSGKLQDFLSWWKSSPMGAGFPPDFFGATIPAWYLPKDRRKGNFLLGPPIYPPWQEKGSNDTKESAELIFVSWLKTSDGKRFISKWRELHPSDDRPWWKVYVEAAGSYLGA